MINKILLQLCIWLIYRQVVMHQHFQKFFELRIRTDVAERDLRNIVFSDRKSTRLNSSHNNQSRMPSSA